MIRYFDEAAVALALNWQTLVPAMERALIDFSGGGVQQPVRQWLPVDAGRGFLGVMPAVGRDVMGLKAVTLYPQNPAVGRPAVMALILLFDPNSGEPLAVLEANGLTAARTAAVSALMVDRFASLGEGVVAVLGSGRQAAAHLAALRTLRAVDDVRVWSATAAHAHEFARLQDASYMASAEQAVRGADIVLIATSAREPVLQGTWVKDGAFVVSIGAPQAAWRELDDAAMNNLLVVDSRAAALEESGDVILSRASIFAEAGELLAGTCSLPPQRTVVFKALGLAIEDLAAACIVLEHARA